jgi:hypothetical protein
MKKQVLICGIVAMMSQNVAAQEKNYRDEYILVTEEYEVGDTIEAKRKAEEQARIDNEQILEANAFRLGIVNVIDSLINNKIKKVKDERSLQIVKDAYDYKKWRFVSREEEDAAKTGKLVGRAYNMLSEYKKHQQEEYAKYTERKVTYSWKNYLTLHKETRTVKKKNPNYRKGYTDADAEWQWLEDLSAYNFESRLKHVVTSFPKEENYYTSDKHPDYKIYDDDWKQWYACNQDGKLVGVGYYGPFVSEKELTQAAMLYDYEHNAYNIKGENQAVYRWARYLIESGNYNIDADEYIEILTIGMNKLGANLEMAYRTKRITQTAYNGYMAEIRPAKAKLRKKIEDLKKSKPSRADQDRARKYVQQLKSDNEKSISYNIHERQNGTKFLLVNEDRSFQALLSYTIDDEKKLKAEYKVLEKK